MLKVPTTAEERSEDWQRLKWETESWRRKAQEICSSHSSGSAAKSALALHMSPDSFPASATAAEDEGVETVPESQTKMQKPWGVGGRAHETLGVQWEMQRLWRAGDQREMPIQRQRLWVRR